MKITAIRLKNFLAFENTGWLEFAPLTFLYGKNSAGKSSIIRALRLLNESLQSHNTQPIGSEPQTPFTFQSRSLDLLDFFNVLWDGGDLKRTHKYWPNTSDSIEMGFKFSPQEDNETDEQIISWLGEKLYDFEGKNNLTVELLLRFSQKLSKNDKTPAVILSSYTLSSVTEKTKDTLFQSEIYPSEIREGTNPTHGDSLEHKSSSLEELKRIASTLAVHQDKAFLYILRVNEFPDTDFVLRDSPSTELSSEEQSSQGLIVTLSEQVRNTLETFSESINFLPSNRPPAQRGYYLDQQFLTSLWSEGYRAFCMYLQQPETAWADTLGGNIARVFHNIDKVEVQKAAPLQTNEIASIVIYEPQNESSKNLVDVGYGISQAIPVVAELLYSEPNQAKVSLIEDPELHLDAKSQLDLASIMFEASKSNSITIVETHSEYFVRRCIGLSTKASNFDQVRFFVVERTSLGSSQISQLDITSDGEFSQYWPGGFFEERFEDLF